MGLYDVRQWAKVNGFLISDRGRLPSGVIEAYREKSESELRARRATTAGPRSAIPTHKLVRFPFVLDDGTIIAFDLPGRLGKTDADRLTRYVQILTQSLTSEE